MQAIAGDPAVFRRHVQIESNGKRIAFQPDPWQEQMLAALDDGWRSLAGRPTSTDPPIRRAWWELGRGHAKTYALSLMATWPLLFAGRPLRLIAAAADQDQGKLILDRMRELARLNSWIGSALEFQAAKVRNPRTGAMLEVLTSDAPTSYGQLPDAVLADECTKWATPDLWYSLFSAAGKRESCVLVAAMNAGHRGHWAWLLRRKFQSQPGWHFFSPTCPIASWLSPRVLAEQQQTLPAIIYDQLWRNVWSMGSDSAITEADLEMSLTAEGPMCGDEPGWSFVMGADLGIRKDAAAFVVLGVNQERQLRLAQYKAWLPPPGGKLSLEMIEGEILTAARRFDVRKLLIDAWQAESMAERLSKEGIPVEVVHFSGQVLPEMASSLIEAFSGRRISLWPDEALLRDLRALRIEAKSYGFKLEADRTKEGHADRGVSLALCCLAVRRHPWIASEIRITAPPMILSPGRRQGNDFYQPGVYTPGERRGLPADYSLETCPIPPCTKITDWPCWP
jgi:hypothetical protein